MEQITRNDFNRVLYSNDVDYSDLKVLENIVVRAPSTEPRPQDKTFRNCQFASINIYDQQNRTLKFDSCEIGSIVISGGSYREVQFTNCKIRRIQAYENCTVIKLRILKGCSVQRVILQTISFQRIRVEDSDVKRIDYRSSENNGELIIKKCQPLKISVTGILSSLQVVDSCLEFSCAEDYDFECRNTQFIGLLPKSTIILSNMKSEGSICFHKGVIDSVLFSNVYAKKLDIDKTTFGRFVLRSLASFILKTVVRTADQRDELSDNDVKASGQTISQARRLNQKERAVIDVLDLTDFTTLEDTRLHFHGLTIGQLLLCNFDNYGYFELADSEVTKKLLIVDSNLRSSTLSSVDLTDNTLVTLRSSNIAETSIANFNWHRQYRLTEESHDVGSLRSLRESYRQLKIKYQTSGNKIEALEFQKHELRIYSQVLRIEKFKNLKTFGDFLIVGSNGLFSDYGQNIWKPLFFLFAVHLILFNILSVYFDLGYSFRPLNPDFELSLKAVDYFFYTLLPTHGTELSHPFKLSSTLSREPLRVNIIGGIDFLIRISSGYFIFYFIYASRKFNQQ